MKYYQGCQGMGNFSVYFSRQEKQGICLKILKTCFYTGSLPPTQGQFWSLKNYRVYHGCVGMFLWSSDFCCKFDLVNWEMEWGYCDCCLNGITSGISLWGSGEINILMLKHGILSWSKCGSCCDGLVIWPWSNNLDTRAWSRYGQDVSVFWKWSS